MDLAPGGGECTTNVRPLVLVQRDERTRLLSIHRNCPKVIVDLDDGRGGHHKGPLEQLHSSDHRGRLAHFLAVHTSTSSTVSMTQQQIARHLGTTREVVARLLGEFVRLGVVRTRRGSIAIKDIAALRRIASTNGATRAEQARRPTP